MITQIANSRFRRPLCYFSASLMLTLGLPLNLFAYDPNKPIEVKEEKKSTFVSRSLTAEEMDTLSGRLGNPYYAGQAKFDVVYKGVNLRTGNYSTSATDLSFEGGYGIPVNITRSYSANNIDEGPFGVGWTLSADLRSTAGGLLKSSKAPVRSVPTGIKRRPTGEDDPNVPTDPVEAVVVTDADGKETTIQRDVDGILTTPPWDKNEYETEYEYVDDGNGNLFWILKSNKTMTPDGTVYQYEKKGEYVNGSKPWDDSGATAEPNNVLKPTSVTDRHGNVTTYTYGSTDVQFTKSNGVVAEKPLTGVAMPNGRNIEFTWTGDRLTQVRAYSSAEERKVLYGYTNDCLTSVQQVRTMSGQSAEYGRINRYGYSGNLLTSMTDPRGLTTSISYTDDYYVDGYAYDGDSWRVATITESTGRVESFYSGFRNGLPEGGAQSNPGSNSPETKIYAVFASGTNSMRVMEASDMLLTTGGGVNPGFESGAAGNLVSTQKYFDNICQNLVEERLDSNGEGATFVGNGQAASAHISKKITSYNFLGNPLKEDQYEYASSTFFTQGVETRHITTETAYWGENKYFQQKAVKVSTSGLTPRYSYTDYYDSSAATGSKGQTYKVHDTENGGIFLDTNETVPSYGTGYAWKYQIKADPDKYSAKFEYDSKGRPVDVWKLQKIVGGTYNYVQTKSVYGADNAPAYGNATQVTEDYGGASARTTQTLTFDLMGKATQTVDAASRTFSTTYDVDGNVLSVNQGSQNIVSYTYGTTDATVENGQPLTIVDGLSGVEQEISYVQSGAAKGMPLTIDEDAGGGQTTSTTYTYDDRANRETSTVTTPNGTSRYKYSNYGWRATGTKVSWVFTKINKQDYVSGSWVDSEDQVEYKINGLGQLKKAYFAMTPQSGQSNYNTNDPYSFVSAEYEYDSAGRTISVKHYWNQLNSTTQQYDREAIRGSTAAYAHPLGLKTSTTFLTRQSSQSTNWATVRTEEYGYDSSFDYLTDVDYNDGLSNEVQSWDYDAAGNRIYDSANTGTWTYDNLNRMSASPGTTYTHDAVGNRLTKVVGSNSTSYGWDAVNRMVETGPTSGSKSQYKYRADGMRVRKTGGGVTESVFYDGQMPVETFEDVSGSNDVLTQNFVGARGIEMMETKVGSGSPTQAYPLYDIHGNMIATVSTTGTAWTVGNVRSYDVWGSVRSGATTGGPKGRYVANLGHVQDDESGLIYMRARYYEPGTGRFISQDIAREGTNMFVYAGNNPILNKDFSGKFLNQDTAAFAAMFFAMAFALIGKGSADALKNWAQFEAAVYKTMEDMAKYSSLPGNQGTTVGLIQNAGNLLLAADGVTGAAKKVASGITLLYYAIYIAFGPEDDMAGAIIGASQLAFEETGAESLLNTLTGK